MAEACLIANNKSWAKRHLNLGDGHKLYLFTFYNRKICKRLQLTHFAVFNRKTDARGLAVRQL